MNFRDDFRRLAGLSDTCTLSEAAAPKKLTKFTGPLQWTASNPREPEDRQVAVKSPNGDIYTMIVAQGWKPNGMSHSDKFIVTVFGPMSVTLVRQDGFKSREAAEEFAKQTVLNAMNAKLVPVAAPPASATDEVKSALSGRKTKTGGRLNKTESDPDSFTFEPEYRQRLDHFGNDGEGWDEEGWAEDYAGPLVKEVEALLKAAGIKGWVVDVGEKGHVHVQKGQQ
jgi:hypothetical protein